MGPQASRYLKGKIPHRRRAIVTAPIYHLIPNAPKPVAPYSHSDPGFSAFGFQG